MSFLLLQNDTLYKKDITQSGSWLNGVYVDNAPTVLYPEIEGVVDPYQDNNAESLYVPSGVSNSDAFILYSDEELLTHKSLPEGSYLADVVYFNDPTSNPNTAPYIVWEKGQWSSNGGFKLIDSFYSYLIVREDLV